MRTLFVTWDGPQVSYLESLFLPIFEALMEQGFPFDILQFRWGNRAQEKRVRARCLANGIGYRSRPIHRGLGGLAPFATALSSGRAIKAAARHFGSDVIMPRSLMPALATLSVRHLNRPVVFDADGLQADERVEFAGLSPTGAVYRILRDVEAQIIRRSVAVLTRSPAASEILLARAGPPVTRALFHTVANGRDVQAFCPGDDRTRHAVRQEIGVADDAPLLIYAGSVGAQYQFDEAASLLRLVRARRDDVHLLTLSGSPEEATATLIAAGAPPESFTVMRSAPDEVPRYLAAADVGIAFRTPSFSMQAVSPIKIAEYLLCGLPVVGNAEIGDTAAAVKAGVFLDTRTVGPNAADWIVDHVLPHRATIGLTARQVGVEKFSLESAVNQYLAALRSVSIGFGAQS